MWPKCFLLLPAAILVVIAFAQMNPENPGPSQKNIYEKIMDAGRSDSNRPPGTNFNQKLLREVAITKEKLDLARKIQSLRDDRSKLKTEIRAMPYARPANIPEKILDLSKQVEVLKSQQRQFQNQMRTLSRGQLSERALQEERLKLERELGLSKDNQGKLEMKIQNFEKTLSEAKDFETKKQNTMSKLESMKHDQLQAEMKLEELEEELRNLYKRN